MVEENQLDASGKAKGGIARAQVLSADERREIAKKGAAARWISSDAPKAEHTGELKIGDLTIPCAVLPDGRRVLSQRGVGRALGRGSGGKDWKLQEPGGGKLPFYLSSKALIPFISQELLVLVQDPIEYRHSKGGGLAHGIPATAVPLLCDVWLKAREARAITAARQLETAQRAEILMRGLAHVGIIALVDEATGYQDFRARTALGQILEAYIAKELLPWTRRFPSDFYREMFRLRGWQYDPVSVKRPILVGKLTEDIVYKRLPPGVLDELKKKNPKNEKGRRKHKHHQFLSEDVGNPHLEKHLAVATSMMRISKSWPQFSRYLKVALPKPNEQYELIDDDIEHEGGSSS